MSSSESRLLEDDFFWEEFTKQLEEHIDRQIRKAEEYKEKKQDIKNNYKKINEFEGSGNDDGDEDVEKRERKKAYDNCCRIYISAA